VEPSTLPAAHEVCWNLRPPVWVQGLSAAVTLAVAAGLATALSWMNFLALPWAMLCLCVLAVTLIIRTHLNTKRVLCAAPGHWRVLDENGRILLAQAEVLHRWTGLGWMTLRLRGQMQGQTPAGNNKQRSLNAVIWQASTAPQDWRLLQKWSLRQAARTALAGATP